MVDSRDMKLLVLGLLTIAGAFAQKIEIEFDQSIDFSKFKTFAIPAMVAPEQEPIAQQ